MAKPKTEVTPDMRRIFFEHEGWYAPDEEVLRWWNTQVNKAKT